MTVLFTKIHNNVFKKKKFYLNIRAVPERFRDNRITSPKRGIIAISNNFAEVLLPTDFKATIPTKSGSKIINLKAIHLS